MSFHTGLAEPHSDLGLDYWKLLGYQWQILAKKKRKQSRAYLIDKIAVQAVANGNVGGFHL